MIKRMQQQPELRIVVRAWDGEIVYSNGRYVSNGDVKLVEQMIEDGRLVHEQETADGDVYRLA